MPQSPAPTPLRPTRPTRQNRPDRPARPEPPLRVLVGAILRGHRERQGRTLRDVAGEARVSVPYLSEVERGRKEASSEVLGAVCRALGLRLVDLVGEAHARLAHADGRVVLDLTAAREQPALGSAAHHAPAPTAGVHPLRPSPPVVALAA
ncbi:helix-turn-helix domain-containing protein [Cellulomonas triticagri]|uniref:XRE family transcriptional regulator n=1 Tax=Cellulomonas triticagri TaxID=2483352 RepID=A0A3M2IUS7_9CELL|nr:helix-turn-helix transcriptional regulator [Cellulomonas triticagri]RMI04869.1 XRE family transcriptional regulator [Cellulomonas triticagri]